MDNATRTVVSLFSGAGGFDWGFHRAGFKTQLAVELLEDASATLALNLGLKTLKAPCVPKRADLPAVVQGDIVKVEFSDLDMRPDVVIGGPPCQDFSLSTGSKRQGLNGGRGKLYREFLRVLMFLQPKVCVFENVEGFVTANKGLAYKTVIDDMRHLEDRRREVLTSDQPKRVPQTTVSGYEILFNSMVDAPDWGIPQARRRLIVIGIRHDITAAADGLLDRLRNDLVETLNQSSKTFRRYPLTCIEIFEGQPLNKLQEKYKAVMQAYSDLSTMKKLPKAAVWRTRVWNNLTFDIIRDYFAANFLGYELNFDQEVFDAAMREHEKLLKDLGWLGKPVYEQKISDHTNDLPKQSEGVKARMQHIPPDENAEFVNNSKWKVENKEISFIYRRSAPLKPAWTVMAHGGGGTYGYHYARDRSMLTLRERARIQTFTDDFLFVDPGIRAQIGEAVPPLLGQRIAEAIMLVLDKVENLAKEREKDDQCAAGEPQLSLGDPAEVIAELAPDVTNEKTAVIKSANGNQQNDPLRKGKKTRRSQAQRPNRKPKIEQHNSKMRTAAASDQIYVEPEKAFGSLDRRFILLVANTLLLDGHTKPDWDAVVKIRLVDLPAHTQDQIERLVQAKLALGFEVAE